MFSPQPKPDIKDLRALKSTKRTGYHQITKTTQGSAAMEPRMAEIPISASQLITSMLMKIDTSLE